MIRVGFVLEGASWQGGVNYYRNLLSALEMLDDRKLCPVMFVGTRVPDEVVRNFPHAEIVRTSILDSSSPAGLLRRVARRLSGQRDLLLGPLLARHRIDVLSHSGPIWPRGKIKTIGWITDFQHLHLPEFFSDNERGQRSALFRRIARECDRVLISSKTAQNDLAEFAPEAVEKSRVLHFIPAVNLTNSQMPIKELENKYSFKSPYFYLPNQFWRHKNHKIVIEALALLKNEGVPVTVLATGNTEDYRHPSHFPELMAEVKRLDLADSFKVLGVVPYGDLLSLMRNSLAVINPSLFEGWSSTVEEAKALGVAVLLSDLPVHREQDPSRGLFFNPANPADLASKMRSFMASPETGNVSQVLHNESYLSDRLAFAQEYQNIVVSLMRLE